MKYKTINIKELRSVDENNYTLRAVFSTPDTDRQGDRVDQSTFKTDNFLQNPVVLFSHDHNQPAVGRVLSLNFNDIGELEGVIQFAAEEYEFARVLWSLYSNGFMRAVSIGFINEEVEATATGAMLINNELLEVSLVNVPANARALAKQKGIDLSPIDNLEAKHQKSLTKEEVNKVNQALADLNSILTPERSSETTPPEQKTADETENEGDAENGFVEPDLHSPTLSEEGSTPSEEENEETPDSGGEDIEQEDNTILSTDNSTEVDVQKETPKVDRAVVSREQKKRLVNKRIREMLTYKKTL